MQTQGLQEETVIFNISAIRTSWHFSNLTLIFFNTVLDYIYTNYLYILGQNVQAWPWGHHTMAGGCCGAVSIDVFFYSN